MYRIGELPKRTVGDNTLPLDIRHTNCVIGSKPLPRMGTPHHNIIATSGSITLLFKYRCQNRPCLQIHSKTVRKEAYKHITTSGSHGAAALASALDAVATGGASASSARVQAVLYSREDPPRSPRRESSQTRSVQVRSTPHRAN